MNDHSGSIVVQDHRLGRLSFPGMDRVIAPAIAAGGSWELREGAWLDAVLRPGMTFVNVGANVGYFSLWARQLVGSTGRVVAVEPDPANHTHLRRNLESRGWHDVRTYRAAAGVERGDAVLHRSGDNCGDHRLGDAPSSRGDDVTVQQIVMDDLLRQDRVDVVLTDTQGWDHHVLAGMRNTIDRDRPCILTEFVPEWLRAAGESPNEILSRYRSWGYDIGLLEAGYAPGECSDAQILDFLDRPGRVFGTLELWPAHRPKPWRASVSAEFWPLEFLPGGWRSWLVTPRGRIHVTGPADTRATLTLLLLPAPDRILDVTTIDTRSGAKQRIVESGATDVTIDLRTDGRGLAAVELQNHSDPYPERGRPLHVAVVSPRLTVRN